MHVKNYPTPQPISAKEMRNLRGEFFDKLTRKTDYNIVDFNCMPHNVFIWFEQKIAELYMQSHKSGYSSFSDYMKAVIVETP